MKDISQRELRNTSASVMDAVERGESFRITRHGTVVAELHPVVRGFFVGSAKVKTAFAHLPAGGFAASMRPRTSSGSTDTILLDAVPHPRANRVWCHQVDDAPKHVRQEVANIQEGVPTGRSKSTSTSTSLDRVNSSLPAEPNNWSDTTPIERNSAVRASMRASASARVRTGAVMRRVYGRLGRWHRGRTRLVELVLDEVLERHTE